MTLEMQQALEREMDDALAITDPERRHDATLTVLAHQSRALVDCQRKTAERVKTIVSDVSEMKPKVERCAESDKEYRETKLKAKGAKWAFGVILASASVVGPVAAIKICKVIGILW